MKKILYIVFIGLSSLMFSQENDLDKITSDLYLTGDWEGLIDLTKKINTDHFTTYETEYRLAVAYYSTGNYFDSAAQFEHIIAKYNIKNDLILEYLYYSYLFSGRQQDALLVAKDLPFHLQVKTDTKKYRFIDQITAEGGLKLSDSEDLGINNLTYFNAGIGQQLGYKTLLKHAFTNISQDYIDFNYKQKEYYGSIRYQMGKGLTLIPSYHYVNTAEEELSYVPNSSFGKNKPMNSQETETSSTAHAEIKTNIFHLAVKKQWNRFFISPNIIYITTNNNQTGNYNKMQYGLNTGLSLKPTHDKLWIGGGVDLIANDYDNNLIWNAKAYYGIGTKAYLYLRYLSANTSDFVLEDAMYYYNSVSVMKDNLSATFGYRFSPKFLWYLNYQFENAKDIDHDLNFTYNTIITGLKIDL